LNNDQTIDKGISDIVGCLTDPIIVFPGGWGDTIPDWLKNAITLERMMANMNSEKVTGTDAEACAYLMTVSLTQSMDSDWVQIYLYVAGKTNKQWNQIEMPDDIAVNEISNYQMEKLERLKDWIYQQRIRARIDSDRTERRQNREEEKVQSKREQPAMFDF
jgi:hypothetical protein